MVPVSISAFQDLGERTLHLSDVPASISKNIRECSLDRPTHNRSEVAPCGSSGTLGPGCALRVQAGFGLLQNSKHWIRHISLENVRGEDNGPPHMAITHLPH